MTGIFIQLSVCGIATLVACILFFKKENRMAFRFQAINLVTITGLNLNNALLHTSFYTAHPDGLVVPLILLATGPGSFYFFYKKILYPEKRLGTRDALHLIPVFLIVAILSSFWLLTEGQKLHIAHQWIASRGLATGAAKLPELLSLYVLMGPYGVFMFGLTYRTYARFLKNNPEAVNPENKSLHIYLENHLYFRFFAIVLIALFNLIRLSEEGNASFTSFSNIVFLLYPLFYYCKYPFTLLGLPQSVKWKFSFGKTILPVTGEMQTETVSPGQSVLEPSAQELRRMRRIDDFLAEQKPYLQGTCTLETLAGSLNMPVRTIGATIKKVKGMNYNAYINFLRINYLLERLQADSKWMEYNIESLCYSIGFNSPSRFYLAFKQVMGLTPREYLDQLAKEQVKEKPEKMHPVSSDLSA